MVFGACDDVDILLFPGELSLLLLVHLALRELVHKSKIFVDYFQQPTVDSKQNPMGLYVNRVLKEVYGFSGSAAPTNVHA
jgi:hypothetical protein